MQNNKKNKVFFATIILAVIFTVLRTVLLYTNFDFDSGFFNVKALATTYYVLLLIVCAVLFAAKKTYTTTKINLLNKKGITTFFGVAIGIMFLALVCINSSVGEVISPLEKIARYVCLISSVISVFFYLTSAFIENTFTKVLNLAPVIYFVFATILSFINQTGFASTYNDFSNVLSLMALAFIVLKDGKYSIDKDFSPVLPIYFMSIIVLCQSAVPDLITFATGHLDFDMSLAILSVMKIFYVVIMSAKYMTLTHTAHGDKK